MPTSPTAAAIICRKLAVRSPKAVKIDRLNPLLMLLDSISRWLGPGVLIRMRMVPA